MKKSTMAIYLALAVGSSAAPAAVLTSGIFEMYDPSGVLFNVDTTVTGSIGGGTWSVASTQLFFGQLWTAHSGTTFGPGTYTIATVQGGTWTGIQVGAGQVGGHILFNWGGNNDIDVVNVWNVAGGTYTSVDVVDSNGAEGPWPGLQMIDGPFQGFSANFSFPVPVPAALWLFGSGLLGLVGLACRNKTVSATV